LIGCAIVYAFSYWLLTAEAWVCTQDSPYRICGGQSGAGTGLPLTSSVVLCHCHSTAAPYSLMYHLRLDSGPVGRCCIIRNISVQNIGCVDEQ
jgi:hypothetical protein